MTRKWIVTLASCLALAAACEDDDNDTVPADGSAGDGTGGDGSADGAPGDGEPGDGSADGAPGDGAPGDGEPGDGEPGDGDAGAEACSSQMYEKYGQAGFEAVNANILTNIGTVSAMEPSPIGDSFKGLTAEDVARVEANLLDFLVLVYGGPNNYEGQTMEESHTGLNITMDQYNAFVGQVIVPALVSAGVPESDINDCFAPPVVDEAFIATIVGR